MQQLQLTIANDAYTAAASGMQVLGIWQKSDIKRADAAQNATIAETTLKDQLDFLQTAFDVFFTVDGTEIRIEHISYFDAANGDDLTSLYPDNITKTNRFTFDEQDTYPSEKYEWMDVDPAGDEDFVGRDIVYDCADEEEEPLEIKASQFSTDFSSIVGNPEAYEDAGFVLISLVNVSGTYGIKKDLGEISGEYKLNGHLSWANIHANYKTYERPQPTGQINGSAVTFDSVMPKKRQEGIFYAKTVDQFFSWDVGEKVKTNLGWGRIETAQYNSRTCKLTITLLHD